MNERPYLSAMKARRVARGLDVTLLDTMLSHVPETNKHLSWGAAMWTELHQWARTFHGSAADGQRFLVRWVAKIPMCGGCRTRGRDWMRENPFDPDNPFEWSVAFHDSINLEIGVDEFGLEAAEARWPKR